VPILTDRLTPQQAQILRLIGESIARVLRPPTYRQLMAWTGISSPNGVRPHLLALQRKGYIRLDCKDEPAGRAANARGIEVVGLSDVIGGAVREYVARLIGEELK
jgi:SOS-response transcriptional repressor LexA